MNEDLVTVYDPKYGDDTLCQCGHPYYRHFDTYDHMRHVGCKYCDCFGFHLLTQTKEKPKMDGYGEARKLDSQIGDVVGYQSTNAEWTGRSLDELQELVKFVRTVGTTLNILEQSLNAALSQRLQSLRDGV